MSQYSLSGPLNKMIVDHQSPVEYQLPVGDETIPISTLLGKKITLKFQGLINCTKCGRKTKKSFNQGFCYPCFQKLACCDRCIVSPELCHYDQGTCREPSWGEEFCMQDHFVYLANSSGIKVGITRGTQIPTRWIDQGAIQAMPIARVKSRFLSGVIEVIFKNHVADKTNWRAMLKGEVDTLDMPAERDRLIDLCGEELEELEEHEANTSIDSIQWLDNSAAVEIDYPVIEYPTKVTSMGFDKKPEIEGVLMGIKGQYLILDTGVINIRKHTAYHVDVCVEG